MIFDESCLYDPEVDNSLSDEAFAAIIEDVTENPPDLTHLEPVSFLPTHDPISAAPPVIEQFNQSDYQEQAEYDIDPNPEPFLLIVADSEEYELRINEYGIRLKETHLLHLSTVFQGSTIMFSSVCSSCLSL